MIKVYNNIMKKKIFSIFILSLLIAVLTAVPFSVLAEDTDASVQPISPPSTADIFFYILLGVLCLATVIIIYNFIANKKFKLKDTDKKSSQDENEPYTLVTFSDENFSDTPINDINRKESEIDNFLE